MFHVEQIVFPVGEVWNEFVAGLRIGFGKIDGTAGKAGRGAGFQSAKFEADFAERGGEIHGGGLPCPATRLLGTADVHEAAKKSAGCDDHGFPEILDFEGGFHAENLTVFVEEFCGLALFYVETLLAFADPFEAELVGFFVALRAWSPDGWTFFGVEHPELEAGHVCGFAHFATERVDFASQVAFGETADGGVAGHLTDGVEIDGKEESSASHAGSSEGGLDAGVAGAENDYVILDRMFEHRVGNVIENVKLRNGNLMDCASGRCGWSDGWNGAIEQYYRIVLCVSFGVADDGG